MPFYSQMGRPSVDPELMIRMLIVGYCMGIGPSAGFATRFTSIWPIAGSVGSGWTAGFPITDILEEPTLALSRERHAVRRLFENVVQRCIAEGLISADGFAVHASLIAADANKQRSVPSREWKPEEIKETTTRAAQE